MNLWWMSLTALFRYKHWFWAFWYIDVDSQWFTNDIQLYRECPSSPYFRPDYNILPSHQTDKIYMLVLLHSMRHVTYVHCISCHLRVLVSLISFRGGVWGDSWGVATCLEGQLGNKNKLKTKTSNKQTKTKQNKTNIQTIKNNKTTTTNTHKTNKQRKTNSKKKTLS